MRDQPANPIERFLGRLLKRSDLTFEEQAAILALPGNCRDYRAHSDIVSPGEEVGQSCLVVEGLVGRFDQMRDGERQITAFYIPGDMSDLHSVVAPKASWSISAISTATVFMIPHGHLKEIATRYPAIALAFWRDTTVDSSIFAKWVGNLGRKGSISRIAHVICEMGVRMEYADLASKTSFALPASQEQLADAAGITPVHMNRMLQELRRRELLTMHRGHVEVLDWSGLAAVAEFDPAYLMVNEPPENAAVVRPALQLAQ